MFVDRIEKICGQFRTDIIPAQKRLIPLEYTVATGVKAIGGNSPL